MERKSLLVCSSTVFYLMFTIVAGQNETIEATLTPTVLYTPGYADGAYGINVTYDYLITTNITNHTVLATVTDCDLEGSFNKKEFCNDKGTVYDGNNTSATKLGEFCCQTESLPTYQSSGESLYIVFTSDESDQRKGFSMTVQSDGPTTTTTTTTQSTTQTTTQSASSLAQTQASTEDSKNYTWIIVGSVIGGVNLIIVIVIVFVCFLKKPDSAKTPGSNVTSRILWSRANTMVEPISTKDVPPGEIVQTNIFDMDLPAGDGKANQLPPLRQNLSAEGKEM